MTLRSGLRLLAAALCAATFATAATAQDLSGWGDVRGFLIQTLAPGQEIAAFAWLPDNPDPALAREAIGVVYPEIVGSAGNVDIRVAYYARGDAGFSMNRTVSNVFGMEPRNAQFLPDQIEVTTTVLGPNDPRCCPSLARVWSISRTDWSAHPLN
ncbi:hypothetical protein [Defluviimonas salinarum]|uniref:Uncharacterized protein n=1 Tax=Defluviimonas salinarum TaxID=2992147 RepID=A0ABT3J4N0_9RHOB|nr:hypothetical protein [Defluviimonas salinarum]MCW3782644.1 hypothetical protein [Defluviimonas salinarum]